jgi:hypothetical protein
VEVAAGAGGVAMVVVVDVDVVLVVGLIRSTVVAIRSPIVRTAARMTAPVARAKTDRERALDAER